MTTAGMYIKAGVVTEAENIAPGWRDAAACRDADTAIFFRERGENATAAKAVCAGCPVREACLEYALVAFERFGVWGGLSEVERRRLRAKRARFQGRAA